MGLVPRKHASLGRYQILANNLGFRIQGSRFRVQGSEFGCQHEAIPASLGRYTQSGIRLEPLIELLVDVTVSSNSGYAYLGLPPRKHASLGRYQALAINLGSRVQGSGCRV